MKRKRLLGLLVTTMLSINALAQTETQIRITTESGDVTDILLSEEPTAYIKGTEVIVETSEASISFQLTEQPIMEILSATVSTEELQGATISVGYHDRHLTVTNYAAGDLLTVYDIQGNLIIHDTLNDVSGWEYDTSSLATGVYILSINNKQFKIFIK